MVKRATEKESRVLGALAAKLWGAHDADELEAGFADTLKSGASACFIKYLQQEAVGFAECSLRHDYVEGTSSSPVGYLEGIFVEENCRGRGFAKELLRACEDWAGEQGCREFASDCEWDNDGSFAFHMAAGFAEANRVICFKKEIGRNQERA